MSDHLNFSGGPGALPESVLRQLSQDILVLPETGLSLLGMSHRSSWFADIVAEAEQRIRALVGIPADYEILFLQGGASLQFSMIAMTLLRDSGKSADYLETGYWSAKAIPEARIEGPVHVGWSGRNRGFRQLPEPDELDLSPDAAYLHYVSNETVEGLQFPYRPGLDSVPRICDMSSDFLSRPVKISDYQMVYAHAQKNIGPAGVTLVVLHKDIVARCTGALPAILDYKKHVDAKSIYNTPPVFSIYTVLLILRWLEDDIGGLSAMDDINRRKAAALYDVIDSSNGFFRPHAARNCRSLMNIAFRLPTPDLEDSFVSAAIRDGLHGLEGHRSIGGLRASLYNAVSLDAVDALCAFMRQFQARYG